MFAWFSCTASFASSMNIRMKSLSSAMLGRMRLTATSRSKPSTPNALERNTSAMPPMLIRSSRTYLPKGVGFFTGRCPQPYLTMVPWTVSILTPSGSLSYSTESTFSMQIAELGDWPRVSFA